MGRTLLFTAVCLLVSLAPAYAATPCSDGGSVLKVLVKGKTPIRRGPGLAYPVSSFLDEGKCMKASEVSTDGAWVLVQDSGSKTFGWVPVKQLDPESQAALGTKAEPPATGPVGSGQTRSYIKTAKATKLYLAPKKGAEVKKPLTEGTQLLALTLTQDGKWVEVRDDRTDTGWVRVGAVKATPEVLAALPRSDGAELRTGMGDTKPEPPVVAGNEVKPEPKVEAKPEPKVEAKAEAKPDGKAETKAKVETKSKVEAKAGNKPEIKVAPPPAAPDPSLDDDDDDLEPGQAVMVAPAPVQPAMGIEAYVGAAASIPLLSLDSNGAAAIRRYNVSALGLGAAVGAVVPMGPLSARLGYNFIKLGGISPQGGAVAIDGSIHDVVAAIGLPLPVGPAFIGPELGYTLAINSLLPAIPGTGIATFLSTTTHAANLGATAYYPLSSELSLDGRAALEVGTTSEGPFALGNNGLSFGARLGAGVSYLLSDPIALVARWDLRYLRTSYDGQSPADPTITTASLTRLENAFALGLAFRL
ncbi:MAG: SH3-like domain-containing protein [Deltaproteobacteria bacterium]|nr:SH3-like domain-containing protein [Deltaproteobacteria bacterium]